MGDASRGRIDRRRTTGQHAGESLADGWPMPGTFLVAAGGAAFVICLVAFAWTQVGVGVAAFVVSLLALGAGLASLTMEGRRVRHVERERLISRRLVKRGH
jgi:membrane protein implicated in regulation of membrane protease activity